MSFIRHWIEAKKKTKECRDEKSICNYRAIAGKSKDGLQNKKDEVVENEHSYILCY